ncbi:heterokaryon incompatibility protein-domain-containing protein [Nemania abortiva]|nr:heterokaryon incompatibility protein-domain-containing protein [Nemania abortiva]
MRLIDTLAMVNDLKIRFKFSSDLEPGFQYAILSHTWGCVDEKSNKWIYHDDEVKYDEQDCQRDFLGLSDASISLGKRKSYLKIYDTCRIALRLGYSYVWIDSCCIDKSNSSETAESINSMFRWYSEAAVCLVYLADSCGSKSFSVGANEKGARSGDYSSHSRRLRTKNGTPCRWFSRCWTLQELLANNMVYFYDNQWDSIGPLESLKDEISDITKIDTRALLHTKELWAYSIETKMSWAATRESSIPEDTAYCLLGLFDVNMPLIYGEGAGKAFQRLQLNIIQSTSDLSVFAWHEKPPGSDDSSRPQFYSLLARSPSQFSYNKRISRLIPPRHHNMTNKGMKMKNVLHQVNQGENNGKYFLCLQVEDEGNRGIGILLRKIGYNIFQRAAKSLVEISNLRHLRTTHTSFFYIVVSEHHSINSIDRDTKAIYIPREYAVLDVLPEGAWIPDRRMLLGNILRNDGVRVLQIDVPISPNTMRITLIFRSSRPRAFISSREPETFDKLFTRTNRRKPINWKDLHREIPMLHRFTDQIQMAPFFSLKIGVSSCRTHGLQLLVEKIGLNLPATLATENESGEAIDFSQEAESDASTREVNIASRVTLWP